MTSKEDREKLVKELREETCKLIGCSGMSHELCIENPHQCKIVIKMCSPKLKETS